ncbi:MAG: hypothetical protein WC501_04825 [Candidatus Micrarchaeia archaeon]
MKWFVLFILILGLSFSATAFPDKISNTNLEIMPEYTSGTVENGLAYYSTSDQVTIAIISAEPMSASDWNGIKEGYISKNIEKKSTSGGIEFYSECMSGEYDDYLCFTDVYKDGIYYNFDVSILDGNKAKNIQETEKIINSFFFKPGSTDPCTLPTLGIILLFPAIYLSRK